jgi:hypothetical protein
MYCLKNGLKVCVNEVTCFRCKGKIPFNPRKHEIATCKCGLTSVDCDDQNVRYMGALPMEHVCFQEQQDEIVERKYRQEYDKIGEDACY